MKGQNSQKLLDNEPWIDNLFAEIKYFRIENEWCSSLECHKVLVTHSPKKAKTPWDGWEEEGAWVESIVTPAL